MDKILTIIIPTYNMEKYLRHCLDSLIVPNMEKMEVLVVNDGSKDSSSSIAHEYQDKYPQTYRVIDKENGNYGSCINRGLKEATGKYVKILDADDSYDSKVLEDFIHVLENVDVDVVLNDFVMVNEDGNRGQYWRMNDVGDAFPVNQIFDFDAFTKKCPSKNIQMHATTYRKSIFSKFDYHQTEGISYTDQQFVFAPFQYVKTAYYYPNVLYLYLMGREGQTMDDHNQIKRMDHFVKVVSDMSSWFEQMSPKTLNYNYLLTRLKGLIRNCYLSLYAASLSKEAQEKLKMFDQHLAQMPHVKGLVDGIKVLHGYVSIAEIWREHQYSFPLWMNMIMKIKALKRG